MYASFLHYLHENGYSDTTVSLIILIAGFVTIALFSRIILRRLKKWSESTATITDDVILDAVEKKVIPLLYVGVMYLSLQNLTLPDTLNRVIYIVGVVFLTFLGTQFLLALIIHGMQEFWLQKEPDPSKRQAFALINTIVQIVVWGLAVLLFLDNIGFKVSALVTGLGIGGIAVALAVQTILGDLFSYFTIYFDKPFEIGDFIIVGEFLGTVEHIGIKTTRLTSLGGEQLVFSNSDLTSSRVRNYKRMQKRRVVFKIGVTYQTPLDKVKEIPCLLKEVIDSVENTVFDRAHFFSYADFSLIYEVVYYVLSNDYNVYMNIQQDINFRIKEEFEKRSIEFAYPTQTVYVNKG